MTETASRPIVIVGLYFPPLNSAGAKRMEALSHYLAEWGEDVVVISTAKRGSKAELSESVPAGVRLFELDAFGRQRATQIDTPHQPVVGPGTRKQRLAAAFKSAVMNTFGQLPDPRLSFALSFIGPFLPLELVGILKNARVVIGTAPPWPLLLAALLIKWRFGVPAVLDYRDHFSNCHEMPGGSLAKKVERFVDRHLAKRADLVVTISEPMTVYYSKWARSVVTIMNGFDVRRVASARADVLYDKRRAGYTVVRYLGVVTPGRIPLTLLAALESLRLDGNLKADDIRFEFYGAAEPLRLHLMAHHPELMDMFRFLDPVAYDDALRLMVSSDWLLFVEHAVAPKAGEELSAAGILPTKMFEYAASGRPILADVGVETLSGRFIVAASDRHVVGNDVEVFRRMLGSSDFVRPEPVEISAHVTSSSRESHSRRYWGELERFV